MHEANFIFKFECRSSQLCNLHSQALSYRAFLYIEKVVTDLFKYNQ